MNVRRLTVMALLGAGVLSGISAQEVPTDSVVVDSVSGTFLPEKWDLQACIDYALQQNITIRKNRVTAQSTEVDVKTAKAALFPSLSFSTSHNVTNYPYQESNATVSGDRIISSNSNTNYSGNYGLNASWTIYNGSKRLKTIKQEQLNKQVADLDVETSEKTIQESIAQTYIQILYAAESVKVNENTVEVSIATRDRGKAMLEAGSISQSDYAQLESQVSTDRYQLVTAQTTLENYKLELKQLLELDGENEMNLYIPVLSDDKVLAPLPAKADVYASALATRPEIEAGKLNVEASELGIDIAKAGYIPTVSLSAGISANHTTGSDLSVGRQLKQNWSNAVGISVSVPIFNNRETKSAVQKAKLQRETSMLELLDQQKTLYKTIEGLWLDASSAQQQYVAANDKLKSSQTSYNLVSEQFNLGMKNTVELLTEKNTLLQAQQEQLQAKYMAILNAELLKFYEGSELNL